MLKNIIIGVQRPMKTLSIVALAFALAGGLAAQPALADLPNTPANVKIMDKNNDGKVVKREYLAYMGAQFDKLAGNKGYCTFTEVSDGMKKFASVFPQSAIE